MVLLLVMALCLGGGYFSLKDVGVANGGVLFVFCQTFRRWSPTIPIPHRRNGGPASLTCPPTLPTSETIPGDVGLNTLFGWWGKLTEVFFKGFLQNWPSFKVNWVQFVDFEYETATSRSRFWFGHLSLFLLLLGLPEDYGGLWTPVHLWLCGFIWGRMLSP